MLKPEKSLIEQLKELEALKSLMGGAGAGSNELLLKVLAQQQTPKTPEAAGVDSMMLNFEKIHTMVKTLAPQVNMGGVMGGLAGLLNNPKIQEAVGGFVQQALPVNGKDGKGADAKQPPAQPQPPTRAVTPEMHEAAKEFAIAQTDEFRTPAIIKLMQAMYVGGWMTDIEPVLQQARIGNIGQAQQFVAGLIQQMNPSKVTLKLVNMVLRSSAVLAGDEGKKMLEALDKSDGAAANGNNQQAPATATPSTPGAIETPNAKVIPITQGASHPHQGAFDAQIAAVRAAEEAKAEAKANAAASAIAEKKAAADKAEKVEKKDEPIVAAAPEPAPTPAPPPTEQQEPQQQQPTASA